MKIFIDISYLFAILSFIVGLKYLSYPSKAREGNLMAGVGMTVAIIATVFDSFYGGEMNINLILILIAVAIGTWLGKKMSDRAEMTEMPQLVSLFNALGGGCALLLGIIESQQIETGADRVPQMVLLAGMVIGAASFTGSIVAYYKLSGKKMNINGTLVVVLSRLSLTAVIVLPTLVSLHFFQISLPIEALILGTIGLLYGVFFVIPIGGADMPVVISLLNSLTGVATALAGILYGNVLMIAGGILVGAAGILLTLMMCKAMNRSLLNVLSGKFKSGKQLGTSTAVEMDIRSITMGEFTTQMAFANKVGIVPGYGLAVAQAQHICSQLDKTLESKGVEVHYIIHPVAGRMPGHMNVLLAEADVPYEKLREMDEVNHEMNSYDLIIVIGANDVVNPAAEKDENSPIYGMPIIKAYNAKQVVVIKRGMSKGYAGVENSLFGEPNCRMVFADAKTALNEANIELKRIA